MGYVTLYRKWRPQTFEDVVGQEHIIRTLTNALKDNRVAHAYLFSGPRGTGKTSVAKILAKALNCENGPTPTPCNECRTCIEITGGSSLDVVEIDAASNRGIDEIRDLREKVKFMPTGGGTKVYIIDEVHMLTPEAFNALLKMLEEPPLHVVFILATTEPHKILPTILSRCQRFDFRRLKTDELAGRLRDIAAVEKIDIDDESIALIAKQAKGGMRDAISTLDQLSSYTGSVIRAADVMAMLGMVDSGLLFRIADIIKDMDAAASLHFVNEIVEAGWDLRQFSKDMTEHFRDLFVIKNTTDHTEIINATTEEITRLEEQAGGFSAARLTDVIESLSSLNNEMRYAVDPRLILELALVKLTTKREDREEGNQGIREEKKNGKRKTENGKPEIKDQEPKTVDKASEQSSWDSTNNDESQPACRQAGNSDEASAPAKVVPGKQEQEPSNKLASGEAKTATPEPAKEQFAPGQGHELDTVKRAWSAVLEQVKKKKMSTYALLLECRPVAIEKTIVVLEFNERATFHKDGIEKEQNRKFIEGVLREVTGKPYSIKCVQGTNNVESPKVKEAREAKKEIPPPAVAEDAAPAAEQAGAGEASAAETEEGKIAAITGLFDATLIEKKERTDED